MNFFDDVILASCIKTEAIEAAIKKLDRKKTTGAVALRNFPSVGLEKIDDTHTKAI